VIDRVGKTPVGLGGSGVFGDQRTDALDSNAPGIPVSSSS